MRMLLLTGAAAALLAIDADAQRDRRGNGLDRTWRFLSKKYDADRNGKISFEEYKRDKTKFESMDQDGDGVLTEADFEGGGRRGRRGRRDRPGRRGRRGGDDRGGMGRDGRSNARDREVATLGEEAPDFELPTVKDPKKTVKLSGFAGKKPVALIFGSYT